MPKYREKRYRSYEEFQTFETPRFDSISDDLEDLMDAVFLDEVHHYAGRDEDDLFEAAEADWA